MKRLAPLIICILTCCVVTCPAQTQTGSFTYDGLVRNYRVHLPTSCLGLPLVFNLHGLGSNAAQQEFYSGFNSVADANDFILVYPDGINNEWNITGTGVDDVGFISALIDSMKKEHDVDLNRVYSTGMSMGGFMSYRLACQLSDRIAAIASVTGLLATFPCSPSRSVPVMQIHGTADGTVAYSGVNSTVSFWVGHNNCPANPVVTNLPDIDMNDGSTVTKSYYGLCDDSTEVILYTVNNGGHTWPDATIDIGVTNHDFNASSEIWDFFKKYDLGLDENTCFTHDISIQSGWNMISTYVIPDTPDILSILNEVSSDILLIKDGAGSAAIPSLGINGIGNWKIAEGYKIKAVGNVTLSVGCEQADQTSTPLSIPQGWSIISYLRTSNMGIDVALAGISSDILLVKDNSGNTYIPSLAINTIGDMMPGQGYKINMGAAVTLYYPANN